MARSPSKSLAQKKLAGTVNKTRDEAPKTAPGGDVLDARPPSWLNTIGKKWYSATAKALIDAGLMKQTDVSALAVAASAFADFIALSGDLDAARHPKPGPDGEMPKPVSITGLMMIQGAKAKAQTVFLSFCKESGLTALSRGKVIIPDLDEGDRFGEFD